MESARDLPTPRIVTATGVAAPPAQAPLPDTRPSLAHRDRLIVLGFVLMALALRVPNLGRAYWVDEGISVGIASHPLSQIPSLLREDGSPPLFYFLLHFWVSWFGSAEWITHLLPLGLSLLAVPLSYWAGRQLFDDRRAGLAAAALMATNPFLNWYSTETRMYTLVVVLAIVAFTLTCRAVRQRRRSDAAWATVAFAALLYSHDWSIYLVAVTATALVALAWSRRDRPLAIWTVGCTVAAVALWTPWIPSFVYQAGNTAAPWAVQPQVGDFFADPASALGGTLGFLIAPILVFGSWWCWRHLSDETRGTSRLLALVAVGTTIAGFVGAQIQPSWTVRYLAVIIAPYLLAASGALATTRKGRALLGVGCGSLLVWSFVGALLPNPNSRYAKSNAAAVARAAASYLHPGDAVIATQTEQVPVLYHYLPAGLSFLTPTGPVPDPAVVDWRNIVGRLQKATPCLDIVPQLQSLPIGSLVLEVNPIRTLGANGSAWSRAVNGQVVAVEQFIMDDPALSLVRVDDPALRPKPFSPMDGFLYRKTAAQPACA